MNGEEFEGKAAESLKNETLRYLLKSNCVWAIYVLVKTPLSGEGLAFIGPGRDLIPASVGR
jgi:hypothetical protein